MEPVPPLVELAVYFYFIVVAAIGTALSLRIWFARRIQDDADGVSH
ncbi:hypothetical protein [Natrarchaeobius halalkaliphilus]|nr:hypothetical protein [Natrarchaeobius halalkaliphilus]